MDLNLVVLSGRLAAPPEVRQFDSGTVMARCLVTIRGTHDGRRRVDVVPVTIWDPSDDLRAAVPNTTIWVSGSVQRRFWNDDVEGGRRSRLEIVADAYSLRPSAPTDD